MRRVVRRIQYWLKKHEHECAFPGMKWCATDLRDSHGRWVCLTQSGVVVGAYGGCFVEHWTEYTLPVLERFFKSAQRVLAERNQHDRTGKHQGG